MKEDLEKRTLAYIQSLGEPATEAKTEKILAEVIRPRFAMKQMFKTVLIEFLEEGLQVISETASILLSPGKALAFRGVTSQPYTFSQELDSEKTLHFSLIPVQDRSQVFLSLRVSPEAPLRAKLQVGGRTVESIQNLSENQWFHSALSRTETPEIVVLKENEEIGRFQLLLKGI